MRHKAKAPFAAGPQNSRKTTPQDNPSPQDCQPFDLELERLRAWGASEAYLVALQRLMDTCWPFGEEMGHPTMGGAA